MPSHRLARRGAAGQQYAIIVGLIAMVAILAVARTGDSVKVLLGSVAGKLSNQTSNATGASPAAPPVDPMAENVLTLLHADGSLAAARGTLAYSNGGAAFAAGRFGEALSVSGGTYVTTGGATCCAGDFTVEAWIMMTSAMAAGTYGSFVGPTATNSGMLFSVANLAGVGGPPNAIAINPYNTSPTTAGTQGSYSFSLNVWYHVAAVRQGNVFRIFVNGTQVSTATNTPSFASTPIQLGRAGSIQHFAGLIDEFRLTTAARYTTDFSPPSDPFP